MKIPHHFIAAALLALSARACIPMTQVWSQTPSSSTPIQPPISVEMSPCFVPGPLDCAKLLSMEIDQAKTSVDVQAYNFTERHIIQSLVNAHARGLTVRIILDKSVPTEKSGGADVVANANIPTFLDTIPRIAHNKVMIIDGTTVVTGSFNFSHAADTANAENVLIISGNLPLASLYENNFLSRLKVSTPYVPKKI